MSRPFAAVTPPIYTAGPTLRDQFAMAALPSLLERHRADVAWSDVAPLAYKIADAMLEARKA